MSEPADLCVCVLFYGSDAHCFKLAQRVLNAPMRQLGKHNVEFRFGFNMVGEETRAFVRDAIAADFPAALWIEPEQNIFKYPMMRRLLHDRPLIAPVTMWFDDDSCLAPDCDVDAWLPRVLKLASTHDIVGSLYRHKLLGNQEDWIKSQWWYNNKPISPYIKFMQGAWWVMQSRHLLRFDWPIPDLKHRGGDVMLGALCEQHGLRMAHFRDGVWINANEEGVESKSPRRGFNENPIGVDYKAGKAQPLTPEYLASRGVCCGAGCLHCPYVPRHQRGTTIIRK